MARLARGAQVSSVVWLLIVLVLPPAAAAQHARVDNALNTLVRRGEGGRINVIVTAEPGERESLRIRLASKGRRKTVEYPEINAVGARLDAEEIASLARDADVTSISYDAPVSRHDIADGEASVVMPDTLRAIVGVPDGLSGRGVGVAIIDSGIAEIPELRGRIAAFYDVRNGSLRPTRPADECGHGTHIAGTIASAGLDGSSPFKGVAPGVRLIGLRVLDKDCAGVTSDVIRALTFATNYKQILGVDVINLSLGHPVYESVRTDPLVRAVEHAVRAGIVVVVSAGNNGRNPETGLPGYGGIPSPANAPSALTVGATNTAGTVIRSDDTVAAYSSRGPSWYDGFAKPDLVAPGHRIIAPMGTDSTIYRNYPDWHEGGTFVRLSGTSMSAAVTSGVTALVIESSRAGKGDRDTLDPYVVRTILEYTATRVSGADALTQGTGQINAEGAVALTRSIDRRLPYQMIPIPQETTFDTETHRWSASVIYGAVELYPPAADVALSGARQVWTDNLVWGTYASWSADDQNVVWGTNLVWGSNLVWGTNLVWGNNLVWGTNVVWGENLVWGSNLVWGENVVWGENLVWGDRLRAARMKW